MNGKPVYQPKPMPVLDYIARLRERCTEIIDGSTQPCTCNEGDPGHCGFHGECVPEFAEDVDALLATLLPDGALDGATPGSPTLN